MAQRAILLMFVLSAAAPCALGGAAAQNEVAYDFEREIGPFTAVRIPPPDPKKPGERAPAPELDTDPGAAKTGRGALRLRIERRANLLDILVCNVPTAGMQTLEFDARASARTFMAVCVEDFDGAKFHHAVELARGGWRRVQIRACDFKISDDSPVKKDAVDPVRLKPFFAIADISAVLKYPDERNTLWVDNVRLARRPLPVRAGGWTVSGSVPLAEPLRIEGDLTLEKGARLAVTAPVVEIAGKVVLRESAALSVQGGVLSVPGAHPYQYGMILERGAKFEASDARIVLAMPWGVLLQPGSRWEAARTEFPSQNLTAAVMPGAELSFDRVASPGEFVIWPRGKVRFGNCSGVLLWLHTEANAKGTFEFPDGAAVRSWTAPADLGLDVALRDCQAILWGLVPAEGGSLAARGAKLRAVGLYFDGEHDAAVRGLKHDVTYGAEPVAASKIRLDLKGSSVQTWNLYAQDRAKLRVEASTFGEAIAYGTARIAVSGSRCDGSGGYFGARDRSRVEAQGCRLACRVIAHDDAEMTLTDCEIEGDVIAADRGRLTLVRCKVRGTKTCAPGAKIEER